MRILLFAFLLMFIACSDKINDFEITEIREAYDIWKSYGITDYSITQSRNCFCIDGGTKVQLAVKEGKIVCATKLSDGTSIPTDRWQWYKTIDQLFETAIEAKNKRPASFKVEFDSKYGFITSLWVDPNEQMADEEFGFNNENFYMVK